MTGVDGAADTDAIVWRARRIRLLRRRMYVRCPRVRDATVTPRSGTERRRLSGGFERFALCRVRTH